MEQFWVRLIEMIWQKVTSILQECRLGVNLHTAHSNFPSQDKYVEDSSKI